MTHELRILNLGAGVQSTTLYLMSIEGLVPAFDWAIFADTQEEPAAVYQHLEWLKEQSWRSGHDDAEWLRIKSVPEDWARAVAVDEALRASGSVANRDMQQTMYVHRSCQPLTQVTFRPRSSSKDLQLGFGVECDGVCGV